ncbi:MAG: hypothetical protein FWD58_06385 [Firmicutes bacterium]|nr:hypothetical protein [Bacillota bacterium]
MTHATIYKGENTSFIKSAQPQKPLAGQSRNASSAAKQTVFFENPPRILAGGTVVTQREADGPIGAYFDNIIEPKNDAKNFEAAEIRMLQAAVSSAAEKAGIRVGDIDLLLSGDLLNQLTSSAYAARDLGVPFMGLYSACATMSQALAVGACFLNAGYFKHLACATASHFATAERQYRYPLEYGAQRPPYAQWTVTGAGCTILARGEGALDEDNARSRAKNAPRTALGNGAQSFPRITSATFGRVVDFGIDDIANMGAAMAPVNAIIAP